MIYIYGSSGHGSVVLEILQKSNIKIDGFIDDFESNSEFMGFKVFKMSKSLIKTSDSIFIAIGNNHIRKRIAESIKFQPINAIHPNSIISATAKFCLGTCFMPGSIVNSNVEIGTHCIINTNASVDHDCLIHNYVHISPMATLCGNVSVGELTHIGAGSVILPNVKIGKNCIIGGGAVVINNVPDNYVVVGNPAKFIKMNNIII